MKYFKKMKFKKIGSKKRGFITALEQKKNIPFEIKRVYYIYNVPSDVTRGHHAHKKLEQILICTSGSVKIKIKDGCNQEIIELNEPSKGLYIGPSIWREIYDYSENCTLMVLASEYYDEEDYIRNYNNYLRYLGG